MFIFLNAQQFIKAMILVGDIMNEYIIDFLQAGINMDKDWIPYDYLPTFTIRKQVVKS